MFASGAETRARRVFTLGYHTQKKKKNSFKNLNFLLTDNGMFGMIKAPSKGGR